MLAAGDEKCPLAGAGWLERKEDDVVKTVVAGVEVDVSLVGTTVICSGALVSDGIREVLDVVDGDVETDGLNGLMVEGVDVDGITGFGVGRTAFTDKNEMTVHNRLLLFADCMETSGLIKCITNLAYILMLVSYYHYSTL